MPDFSADLFSKPLDIGGVRIRNRSFLAPMSGVTDVPFRQLAWKFGAGLVVSEMVASQALVEGELEMQLKQQAGEIPLHVVQLAGRESYWMSRAAKIAEANGAQIIDINMGCPAKRVTTGYSGSSLMRDLDHALHLIDAVVDAVKVPVTLKMRLGWDHDSINAPELAIRGENSGIQMVTVHGRT
ncbi:MAG: tRNA dihydrouridine synthase, partial [Rhizobiaceae bacterium]